MDIQISMTHQTTYDAILQHPASHNLQWHDVRSMLNSITDVEEEHNGNLRFTRHGETLTIHSPKHKDLDDTHEVMKIRHFLERTAAPEHQTVADGAHLLVIIDHREARIYQTEMHGSVPERIVPYDPDGLRGHLHYVSNEAKGHQRQPELKSFYEAIAQTLRGAEKILIFGSSTGASSAMEHLLVDLNEHHLDIAQKVIGAVIVNQQHMTEDQLLAQARAVYTTAAPKN